MHSLLTDSTLLYVYTKSYFCEAKPAINNTEYYELYSSCQLLCCRVLYIYIYFFFISTMSMQKLELEYLVKKRWSRSKTQFLKSLMSFIIFFRFSTFFHFFLHSYHYIFFVLFLLSHQKNLNVFFWCAKLLHCMIFSFRLFAIRFFTIFFFYNRLF